MNVFRQSQFHIHRYIALLMITLIITMGFISTAQAAMVSTQELTTESVNKQAREKVILALQRIEVQEQLLQLGVEPEAVLSRVDSMTNTEINELAGVIDQKPAGSGIIGLLGLVLVVLLITDLLDVTNVYNL
ncbi:MAG: PA2779 family protein [Gammaproteobacteria bacterium]